MADVHLVLQEFFKVGGSERRDITLVAAPKSAPIWDRVQQLLKIQKSDGKPVRRSMLHDMAQLFPHVKGEIDLARYDYTLSRYDPSTTMADGYLLGRRSEIDGAPVAVYFAAGESVQQAWAAAFAPAAPGEYTTQFIAPGVLGTVLEAYGVGDDGGSDCFHELQPYLLSHREHYLQTCGIDIAPP